MDNNVTNYLKSDEKEIYKSIVNNFANGDYIKKLLYSKSDSERFKNRTST